MATKEDIKAEIAGIKDDITATEGRILNAFNQMLTTTNPPQLLSN